MKHAYNWSQSISNCKYTKWRLKEVEKVDYLLNITAE